jgi:hypothetical protein
MLKTKFISIALIIICTSAYGADKRPSEKSIKELLRVTEAHTLLDSMVVQFDKIMKAGMQQALKGQTVTQNQQKQIDDMQNKMIVMFKEELNWKTLEPLYINIYGDSFTQQEVDGMLAFYESPSGHAVIKKMPLVVQNTMKEMQKRMGPFLQKLIKMEEETIEQMKKDSAQK